MIQAIQVLRFHLLELEKVVFTVCLSVCLSVNLIFQDDVVRRQGNLRCFLDCGPVVR